MKNIICFIFLLLVLCSCKQNKSSKNLSPELINNPATASGEKKGELPAFDWKETRFHFGDVKEGDKVTHTFVFKNAGRADLILTAVSPSCGCTVPKWSKEPVKPGEEGKIDVTFNSEGKIGMQSKTIAVMANTIPATRVLTISAEVIPKK